MSKESSISDIISDLYNKVEEKEKKIKELEEKNLNLLHRHKQVEVLLIDLYYSFFPEEWKIINNPNYIVDIIKKQIERGSIVTKLKEKSDEIQP